MIQIWTSDLGGGIPIDTASKVSKFEPFHVCFIDYMPQRYLEIPSSSVFTHLFFFPVCQKIIGHVGLIVNGMHIVINTSTCTAM